MAKEHKDTVKQNDTASVETTDIKAKNKADQENLFASSNVDTLIELALAFGIHEDKIPENPTKQDLMNLLLAAKRHDIAIAKTVRTPDGKEYDCPPGHMVIRVTPKAAGMEWGNKSREVFFFAVQGECVVGKRGATVVIPDKYRSAWRDAIGFDYTMNGDPEITESGEMRAPKMTRVEKPAEDVNELYWNRDLEKEKADEISLIEGSKAYMEEKRAEKALRAATVGLFR